MKSAAFVSILLGASVAVASPVSSPPARGATRRSNKKYDVFRNHPIASIVSDVTKGAHFSVAGVKAAAAAPAESVRGGAFVASSDVRHVSATIRVPAPRLPTEGPTAGLSTQTFMASFYVAIDGVTCTRAALRTGIDIFWDGALDGEQNYYAWYNWYPNSGTIFGTFDLTAGDLVRLNVTATGVNGGFVTMENLETAQTVRQDFANQTESLCLTDAAWIVEDFPLGSIDLPTPFANWSTTDFSAASAHKGSGEQICLTNATAFNIQLADQGGQLTDCSIANASSVSCSRVVGTPKTKPKSIFTSFSPA